ncbi:uncharacterized protein LOC112590650 [Harpegnathos saltator]|uniref:uncharacterized protein LOC112590650 n=1 Tax=Harpegnathos saltator TaxID=610380 RepID=UPI000DBEDCAA|nr:uncharacterized protein LOC112590650 [Harpegnathos saltator]
MRISGSRQAEFRECLAAETSVQRYNGMNKRHDARCDGGAHGRSYTMRLRPGEKKESFHFRESNPHEGHVIRRVSTSTRLQKRQTASLRCSEYRRAMECQLKRDKTNKGTRELSTDKAVRRCYGLCTRFDRTGLTYRWNPSEAEFHSDGGDSAGP